jgi:hypothetical protein
MSDSFQAADSGDMTMEFSIAVKLTPPKGLEAKMTPVRFESHFLDSLCTGNDYKSLCSIVYGTTLLPLHFVTKSETHEHRFWKYPLFGH